MFQLVLDWLTFAFSGGVVLSYLPVATCHRVFEREYKSLVRGFWSPVFYCLDVPSCISIKALGGTMPVAIDDSTLPNFTVKRVFPHGQQMQREEGEGLAG